LDSSGEEVDRLVQFSLARLLVSPARLNHRRAEPPLVVVYLERADMTLLSPREGRGLDVDIQAAVVVQVPAVESFYRPHFALTSREGPRIRGEGELPTRNALLFGHVVDLFADENQDWLHGSP